MPEVVKARTIEAVETPCGANAVGTKNKRTRGPPEVKGKKNGGRNVQRVKPPGHGKIQTNSWGVFVNKWVGDIVGGH